MNTKTILAAVAAVIASGGGAFADQSLNIRGGVIGGLSEYPFAVDGNPITEVFESQYGVGPMLSATYRSDSAFGNFGIELSLSFSQLYGDENAGQTTPPTAASCVPFTLDVLSVSHSLCMDGATVNNDATLISGRLLGSRQMSNGTEVLVGAGIATFENQIQGMMFYPGESSSQSRENDFFGLGLVVGARHEVPINGTWSLGLEGFGGIYAGQRTVTIRDEYVGTIGVFDQTQDATALTLDLAATASREATVFGQSGELEFGIAYSAIFNAVDTANYNTSNFTTGSASPTGSIEDDFSAISLFVGFTIPM